MLNIAVLVSGGAPACRPCWTVRPAARAMERSLVVASKPSVYALERAKRPVWRAAWCATRDYDNSEDFDAALLGTLKHNIDLGAGGLSVSAGAGHHRGLSPPHPERAPGAHPSFCGPGMYGLRPRPPLPVAASDRATVPLPTKNATAGPSLPRRPWTSARRHPRCCRNRSWSRPVKLLPKAVAMVCSGEIGEKK